MSTIKKIFTAITCFCFIIVGFTSTNKASATTDENAPFEKLDEKESKSVISSAEETEVFNEAKKIIQDENYEFTKENLAVVLKQDNSKWAYFYIQPKNTTYKKNDVKPFIGIEVTGKKKSFIQLFEFKKNGTMSAKQYEDNKLLTISEVSKKGFFLKGSYYFAPDGKKYDLTKINNKIEQDLNGTIDNTKQFSWNVFWDCLKKNGWNSMPLRTQILGACYYLCLTGPPGCISCAVINGGMTAGIAGYCVYKAW